MSDNTFFLLLIVISLVVFLVPLLLPVLAVCWIAWCQRDRGGAE